MGAKMTKKFFQDFDVFQCHRLPDISEIISTHNYTEFWAQLPKTVSITRVGPRFRKKYTVTRLTNPKIRLFRLKVIKGLF